MTLKLDSLTIYNQQLDTSKPLLTLNSEIKSGEIVSVMGASGSGKSTLLAAIAGHLMPPFSKTGRIYLNGNCIDELAPYERKIGLMFQDPFLFEHMSVAENIGFALAQKLQYATRSKHEKRRHIVQMLASVGLEEMANRPVQSLSGGQQSRVALLRTLAAAPKAILLDEPFSKLDPETRSHMRAWVFNKLKEGGIPTLMVTHDSDDAVAAGGRIIEISSC